MLIVLTVVHADPESHQIWSMLRYVNSHFSMTPPLALLEDEKNVRIDQFCSGRVSVFMYSSLYRAAETVG